MRSSNIRKARGPAEEYEEEREEECRMGRWEYIGGKERVRRGDEMRYMEEEADVSRWRGFDPRLNRGKWKLEESNR